MCQVGGFEIPVSCLARIFAKPSTSKAEIGCLGYWLSYQDVIEGCSTERNHEHLSVLHALYRHAESMVALQMPSTHGDCNCPNVHFSASSAQCILPRPASCEAYLAPARSPCFA